MLMVAGPLFKQIKPHSYYATQRNMNSPSSNSESGPAGFSFSAGRERPDSNSQISGQAFDFLDLERPCQFFDPLAGADDIYLDQSVFHLYINVFQCGALTGNGHDRLDYGHLEHVEVAGIVDFQIIVQNLQVNRLFILGPDHLLRI